jgi:urocanate hydratase
MGGAQPLAAAMNGGVVIAVEVDPDRIRRRLETRYVEVQANSLEEALALARPALERKHALSIALLGNAADILPRIAQGPLRPDLVTDQTSAHDMLNGYVPHGLPYQEALRLRSPTRRISIARAPRSRSTSDVRCEGAVV